MAHVDQSLKSSQIALETKLREDLISDPSAKNFKAAYDELHTFFLEKAHQEDLYANELKWFSKIFLDIIQSDKKVLDVGSGNGNLAIALARNNNKVIGIDISTVALKTAHKRFEQLHDKKKLSMTFQYGDARKLDFEDNSFDFVVSHDVIEHISENDFLVHLKEIERVLKTGGSYLFWTPSKLRGGSSLGLHLKEYTLKELAEILQKRPFKYSWIDLRFFKFKIVLELPQKLLPIIIWYEKMIGSFIQYTSHALKKILVPPLFFVCQKIEQA